MCISKSTAKLGMLQPICCSNTLKSVGVIIKTLICRTFKVLLMWGSCDCHACYSPRLWRQHAPLKRPFTSTRLHGAILQKAAIFKIALIFQFLLDLCLKQKRYLFMHRSVNLCFCDLINLLAKTQDFMILFHHF
jgi:hypothetical protein